MNFLEELWDPERNFMVKQRGIRRGSRDSSMPGAFIVRIQTILWSRHRYSHFSKEATEAWRGARGCPRSQSLIPVQVCGHSCFCFFYSLPAFPRRKQWKLSWGVVVGSVMPLIIVNGNENSMLFPTYQDESISVLSKKQNYFKVASVITISEYQ